MRIDFVPSHILQGSPAVFQPRNPLGASAKRAGWQGFIYDLTELPKIGIRHSAFGSASNDLTRRHRRAEHLEVGG